MLEQPKIKLLIWVSGFMDKVRLDLQEKVKKDAFVKENGLPYLLPVGCGYQGNSKEFGGELDAVISEITYNAEENEIIVDLSLTKRHISDYDLAINYLLNPEHGWKQE